MSSLDKSFSGSARKREREAYEEDDYYTLFDKMCNSITVHGVYFWGESQSAIGKLLWVIIVLCGLSGSTYVIFNSYESWKLNPVLTSVRQIHIEDISFPAITICPLDTTDFGFLENYINNNFKSTDFEMGNVLLDLLNVIRIETVLPKDDCLLKACRGPDENVCWNSREFQTFRESVKEAVTEEEYSTAMNKKLEAFVEEKFPTLRLNKSLGILKFHITTYHEDKSRCGNLVRDFEFFNTINAKFPNALTDVNNYLRPGSLFRLLYSHTEGIAARHKYFKKYFKNKRFAWTNSLNHKTNDPLPLPALINVLTSTENIYKNYDELDFTNLNGIYFTDRLLKVMKESVHSPQIFDQEGDNITLIARAAVPFCWFFTENITNSGKMFGPYKDIMGFCNRFQTVFNEYGLCYTYNNVNLNPNGIKFKSEDPGEVRMAKGCGVRKGVQITLDSQEFFRGTNSESHRSKGFNVYITPQGSVTQEVHFLIQPEYEGEYNFYMHSLTKVTASKDFIEWNKDEKLCYFPEDKNLTYYANKYSQSTCLMECRILKIMRICGCSPWYVSGQDRPICGFDGNYCFMEEAKNYHDEKGDIKECDCRPDCEGTSLFTTMEFVERQYTNASIFYDKATQTGLLSTYLLDPAYFINDPVLSNLTQAFYNISREEVANLRFQQDVTILNFFYDTPYTNEQVRELRMTFLAQISAIGGTLGLFTGTSLITLAEVLYWLTRFVFYTLKKRVVQKEERDLVKPTLVKERKASFMNQVDFGFTHRTHI